MAHAGRARLLVPGPNVVQVVDLDQVAIQRVIVGMHDQCGQRVLFTIEGNQPPQIHIQHHVAVENQEPLVDQMLQQCQAAGRSQRVRLD